MDPIYKNTIPKSINPVQPVQGQGFSNEDEREYRNVLAFGKDRFDATWGAAFDEHKRKYIMGESLRTAGLIMDAPANPVKGAYVESSQNTRNFIDASTKVAGRYSAIKAVRTIKPPKPGTGKFGIMLWSIGALTTFGMAYLRGSTVGRQASTATAAIVDPGTRKGYAKGNYLNPKGFNTYELQDVKKNAGFMESLLFEMQSDPLDLIAPGVSSGVRALSNISVETSEVMARQAPEILDGMKELQRRSSMAAMSDDLKWSNIHTKKQVNEVFKSRGMKVTDDVLSEVSTEVMKNSTSHTLSGLSELKTFGDNVQSKMAKVAWYTNPVGYTLLNVHTRLKPLYNNVGHKLANATEEVNSTITDNKKLYTPEVRIGLLKNADESADLAFDMIEKQIPRNIRDAFPKTRVEFSDLIKEIKQTAELTNMDEVTVLKAKLSDLGISASDELIEMIVKSGDDLIVNPVKHMEKVHRGALDVEMFKISDTIESTLTKEVSTRRDAVVAINESFHSQYGVDFIGHYNKWASESEDYAVRLHKMLNEYDLEIDDFIAHYDSDTTERLRMIVANKSFAGLEDIGDFSGRKLTKETIENLTKMLEQRDVFLERLNQPIRKLNKKVKLSDKDLVKNAKAYADAETRNLRDVTDFLEVEQVNVKKVHRERINALASLKTPKIDGELEYIIKDLHSGEYLLMDYNKLVTDLKESVVDIFENQTEDLSVQIEHAMKLSEYDRIKDELNDLISKIQARVEEQYKVKTPVETKLEKLLEELDEFKDNNNNMLSQASEYNLEDGVDYFTIQGSSGYRNSALINALSENRVLEKILDFSSDNPKSTGAINKAIKEMLYRQQDDISRAIIDHIESIEKYSKSTRNYLELLNSVNNVPKEYEKGATILMDFIHSKWKTYLSPAEISTPLKLKRALRKHVGIAGELEKGYYEAVEAAIDQPYIFSTVQKYVEAQADIGFRTVSLPDKYFKSHVFEYDNALRDILDPEKKLGLELSDLSEADIVHMVQELTGRGVPVTSKGLKNVAQYGGEALAKGDAPISEGVTLGLKAASNYYGPMYFSSDTIRKAMKEAGWRIGDDLVDNQYRMYLRSLGFERFNNSFKYVFKSDINVGFVNKELATFDPFAHNRLQKSIEDMRRRLKDSDYAFDSHTEEELEQLRLFFKKLGFESDNDVDLISASYMFGKNKHMVRKVLNKDSKVFKQLTEEFETLEFSNKSWSELTKNKKAKRLVDGSLTSKYLRASDLSSPIAERIEAISDILENGSVIEKAEAVKLLQQQIASTSKDPEKLAKYYAEIYRTDIEKRMRVADAVGDLYKTATKMDQKVIRKRTEEVLDYNKRAILSLNAEDMSSVIENYTDGFIVIRDGEAIKKLNMADYDKYGMNVYHDDGVTLIIKNGKNSNVTAGKDIKFKRSAEPYKKESLEGQIKRLIDLSDADETQELFTRGDFHARTYNSWKASELVDEMNSRFIGQLEAPLRFNPKDFKKVEAERGVRFNFVEYGTLSELKTNDNFFSSDVSSSAMTAVEQIERNTSSRIRYIQQYFNDDWNINTSPIWSQFDDDTIYSLLKENSRDIKAAILVKEKGRVHLRNVGVGSKKEMMELMRNRNAIIVPSDTYSDMYKQINDYGLNDLGEVLEAWNKTVVQTYKTSYLTTSGFPVRNFIDSLYKNIQQGNGFVDLPETVQHMIKANDMLDLYDKTIRDLRNQLNKQGIDHISPRAIEDYIKKLPPVEQDMFVMTHLFHDSSAAGNMSEALSDYFKEKDFGSGVPKKWFDKYSNMLWKVPKFTKIYDVSSKVENVSRLGLILQQQAYGETFARAVNQAVEAHFDYSTKSLGKIYGESVIPFLTFPLNNLSYHSTKMHDNPALTKRLLDMQQASWYGNEEEEQKLYRHRGKMYHLGAGNLNLGNHIFKMNPSFFDALKLANQPLSELDNRLIEPLKPISKGLQGEVYMPKVPGQYNVKMVADVFKKKKPVLPSLFSYSPYKNRNTSSYKKNEQKRRTTKTTFETSSVDNTRATSDRYGLRQK